MKVAICDDSEQDIADLKEKLLKIIEGQIENCEIHVYTDVTKFLKEIHTISFDGIFLDIDMPQMDGYETLEEIKKIDGCELIPIIFLTGFSEMDYEVKGLKAGAVDYIVKPFAKEILMARVERHLERYQQRQSRKTVELSKYAQDIKKQLTLTEWKIALAVAEGKENKEIAESMHYSYGYVKNLVARIFSKLEIEKRLELKKMMLKE